MYRGPKAAPASAVAEENRGQRVGRFCHGCGGIYPLNRERHIGKAIYGKDHVSAPCGHEGERFEAGDTWWEEAVELTAES